VDRPGGTLLRQSPASSETTMNGSGFRSADNQRARAYQYGRMVKMIRSNVVCARFPLCILWLTEIPEKFSEAVEQLGAGALKLSSRHDDLTYVRQSPERPELPLKEQKASLRSMQLLGMNHQDELR